MSSTTTKQSPQSSVGRGPASSPFTGTDPTLYSPELARDGKHHRNNGSVTTVVGGSASGSKKNYGIGLTFDKANILPLPSAYVHGRFSNEIPEGDEDWVSRFQQVVQLPDGTVAGHDQEHELFSVQHQMKLVSLHLLMS